MRCCSLSIIQMETKNFKCRDLGVHCRYSVQGQCHELMCVFLKYSLEGVKVKMLSPDKKGEGGGHFKSIHRKPTDPGMD